MLKKMMPIFLVLGATGAGAGVGLVLRPDVGEVATHAAKEPADQENAEARSVEKDNHSDEHGPDGDTTTAFVPFNNQFVVPIVSDGRVISLIVMALSVEVSADSTESVISREPKLRDSFLQILFDHANIGGFEGNFTDAEMLNRLRKALEEVAQRDIGTDIVKDVLIVEIARQDY